MTLTGEGVCPDCMARVLVVRNHDNGQLVRLDPERTDGGWEPMSEHGVLVARYIPPDAKRERHGHHAHALRCARTRSALADSRERIEQACTETRPTASCDDFVRLPVLRPSGLRALLGASS